MDVFGNIVIRFYNNVIGSFGEWYIIFYSGNINFNEFGGVVGSFVVIGVGFNFLFIWFYLFINVIFILLDIFVISDF